MKYLSTLALVFAMLFTLPTWACTLTNSTVPASAVKAIEAECAKAEEAVTSQVAKVDAERLSAYADVATQIAKAVGIAAQEMGVAVNDFIKTPAGILTVAVILVKVLGKLVVAMFFCVMVVYCAIRGIRYLWTDFSDEVPRWYGFGKKTVRKTRYMTYKEVPENQVSWTVIIVIVALASAIPVFVVL